MALELSERVRTFGVGGSRISDLPDLAEIQKASFRWFIEEGLAEELKAFSPIKDYTGRLELHFLTNYSFEDHTEPNKPKTPDEARALDASYGWPQHSPRTINHLKIRVKSAPDIPQ